MSNSSGIVGWIPLFRPAPDSIQTQAMIFCCKCQGLIRTTGGPMKGVLCNPCALAWITVVAAERVPS